MPFPGDQEYSLGAWADEIKNVPPEGTFGSCQVCLGVPPSPQFEKCFKCGMVWTHQPLFDRLTLIAPCSVAISGTPWYSAVYNYKAGQMKDKAPLLVMVLHNWLLNHWERVETALGGEPGRVMVVPSRKRAFPTPLGRVVEAVFQAPLDQRVVYKEGSQRPKRDVPDVGSFDVTEPVAGSRILLIEDTWVGGQTAVSTALALAAKDAEAIALVSIARMVYPDSMTPEYQQETEGPIDFSRWPR